LYFNARAIPALGWRAESRGLRLSAGNVGPIAACVPDRLVRRGLRVPADMRFPLQIQEEDLVRASRIITLDEREHRPYVEGLFPAWRHQIGYWQVSDVDGMRVDEALRKHMPAGTSSAADEYIPHSDLLRNDFVPELQCLKGRESGRCVVECKGRRHETNPGRSQLRIWIVLRLARRAPHASPFVCQSRRSHSRLVATKQSSCITDLLRTAQTMSSHV
jgi:low molecular weight protein-tyrosine phosphatase